MKFAFMADIHLSRYSQDKIEDESNLPERLHSIKKCLYEAAEYCMNNKIDIIVIGGDTLHGKSIIHAIAQEIMLQYFKDFKDIWFYVIDGNHDLSGKGDDVVSALRPLENVKNVRWIKYSETLRIYKDEILFVPYSTQLPKVIKDNKAKILISHFGLSEGILNSGMSITSEISMKDLRGKYDLVLLGHYHKPQEIIEDTISLYYVGSPIQLDWGERNDEKRFLIVDVDTLDIESIPFVSYKKHVQIEVTSKNKDEAIKQALLEQELGNHVKVIMKEHIDLTEIKGQINIVDKTEKDITDRGITSNMSIEDKLKKYLEIKGISEEDQKLYMSIAMEIIRKGDESII